MLPSQSVMTKMAIASSTSEKPESPGRQDFVNRFFGIGVPVHWKSIIVDDVPLGVG